MSGSVNKVILIGNLGADPEIRHTQDGRAVANLRVATSESWRDKNSGERKEKTEWHRISVFNEGLAKVAEQYCRKGQKVYIEGQLQTRKWTDQSGTERYSTEVVLNGYGGVLTMLDRGSSDQQSGEQSQSNSYADATGRQQPRAGFAGRASGGALPIDDDIPFAPEVR